MKKDQRSAIDRFKIPDAYVSIRKSKLVMGLFPSYNNKAPLYDISKSGVSFFSNKNLKRNEVITIILEIPDLRNIKLKIKIRWIKNSKPEYKYIIGSQILPFGSDKKYNSLKSLELLKQLERKNR